ncbi:MAG: hypothetical protein IPN34_10275 [Planctomycetes bacterium]|nr:hypothetical protein [Planctomycetota bacterium]
MTEQLARTKAEELGVPHAGRSLSEVVRAIQQREGFETCFDTGRSLCAQEACCWRESCLGRALARHALELGVPIDEAAAREARTRRAALRFDRRLRRLEQLGV